MKKLLKTNVRIDLSVAEALIILNLIEGMEKRSLDIRKEEEVALWALECNLESQLTEPLIENFAETLKAAKQSLLDKG